MGCDNDLANFKVSRVFFSFLGGKVYKYKSFIFKFNVEARQQK